MKLESLLLVKCRDPTGLTYSDVKATTLMPPHVSLEELEDESDNGPVPSIRTRRSAKETKEEAQARWKSHFKEPPESVFDPSVGRDKCSRCRNLAYKHFGLTSKGVSHCSDAELELAVSHGCVLCKILSAGFGEPRGTSELRYDKVVSVANYYFRGGRGKITATFDVFGQEDRKDKSIPLYRPIASHPDDESCFALIRRWITNCVSSHPQCGQPTQYQLPTRLIDLASDPLRLVTKPRPGQRYNALSYCWGSYPQPTTTKQSLKSHEKSLDLRRLPKTFQDAISVTRKLGVNYLWIDALCILQDSDQDKAIECSNMGMYYRNAYVTISALSASDSSKGFLNRRLPIANGRLFENQELYIRPKTLTRAAIFQQSPLNERGWTLQERLLSTRILHYGHTEVFWECLTCSCREGSTNDHHGSEDVRDLVTSEGEDFKRINFTASIDPKDPDYGAFALWYRLINQFSRRALTYADDALPAMSGLAFSMALKLNTSYIAGLWAEDLDGLLWQVEQRTFYMDNVSHNQRILGLPTWSWASLSVSVSYPFIHEPRTLSPCRHTARLLSRNLKIDPANPFGKVAYGSITLHTLFARNVRCAFNRERRKIRDNMDRLNDMRVQVFRNQGNAKYASVRGTGFFDELHTYNECYVGDKKFPWTTSPTGAEIMGYDDAAVKERKEAMEALAASREFGAVSVAERTVRMVWSDESYKTMADSKVYFLLVIPVEGKEGCWRRVGMGWTSHGTLFGSCDVEEICLV